MKTSSKTGEKVADNFRETQMMNERHVDFYSESSTMSKMMFSQERRFDNTQPHREDPVGTNNETGHA